MDLEKKNELFLERENRPPKPGKFDIENTALNS